MVQISFTQLLEAMQRKVHEAIDIPDNCPDFVDLSSNAERQQDIARLSRLYEECAREYCEIHGLQYEVSLMSPIVIEGRAETAADVLADIADLFDAKIGRH